MSSGPPVFTAEALPLQLMPMAAEVPDPDRYCHPAVRQAARSHHGLPAEAVLFAYGFDLNSTSTRNKTVGAVVAF